MPFVTYRLGNGCFGTLDVDNPNAGLGVNFAAPTTGLLSSIAINCNTNGANTLIAGVTNKTIRVHKVFFIVNANTDITFKDGSTALTGVISFLANGSFTLDLDGEPWFITSSGASFVLTQVGTAQISGRIYYTQS